MFRRRNRRGFWRSLAVAVYPPGGWRRALSYVAHRLRRLPDTPERIARGVAAGVFVSFTPLFGLHFIFAALIARVMRGNIMAALLGTFFGNPFTFPIIVALSIELGSIMLGHGGFLHFQQVMRTSSTAWAEIWTNLDALLSGAPADWTGFLVFLQRVFLPYLVGGIVPGVVSAAVMYYVTLTLVNAYRARRRKKLRARFRAIRAARPDGAEPDDEGGAAR